MTERDLGALLQRASADLVEVDLVDDAWGGALQERARRRRAVTGGVGAVAVAALAVAALQVTGGGNPHPVPSYSVTTPPTTGTLGDRTPYAVLPLEGVEGGLPLYEAGLPQVVDAYGPSTRLSTLSTPPRDVVAVVLRRDGGGYRPVLVTAEGDQVVVDRLLLAPTRDRAGVTGAPLGPRAFGAGRWVVFPQPGKVVRLDVRDGSVTSYAVPSPYVDSAAWDAAAGKVLVRAGAQAWTLDTSSPGAPAVPADASVPDGATALEVAPGAPSLRVSRFDASSKAPVGERFVTAPVTELWGPVVGSGRWVATGAFLDQDVTHPLIRRGNGPIYQGIVAVRPGNGSAAVLAAPENPDGQVGRVTRCCSVLGWADAHTALLQTVGAHGSWVLAWDVESGRVMRVTRIAANPATQEVPRIALAVGSRS
ncbi:hypothetical protein ACFUC1_10130 [Pedococcus sp. NPDC057267]|uniref:hypothetical protein n=1 Tax=Pedococcus sp. NPDC057267 TaxID=3346077 RepID=UPI003635AE51